jgi:hypothetical protein
MAYNQSMKTITKPQILPIDQAGNCAGLRWLTVGAQLHVVTILAI